MGDGKEVGEEAGADGSAVTALVDATVGAEVVSTWTVGAGSWVASGWVNKLTVVAVDSGGGGVVAAPQAVRLMENRMNASKILKNLITRFLELKSQFATGLVRKLAKPLKLYQPQFKCQKGLLGHRAGDKYLDRRLGQLQDQGLPLHRDGTVAHRGMGNEELILAPVNREPTLV